MTVTDPGWEPGDIVEELEPTGRQRRNRGVVIWCWGRGDEHRAQYLTIGSLYVSDTVIDFGSGHSRITNCYDSFRVVPIDELTIPERMKRAQAKYEGVPDWWDGEADGDPPDIFTREWACIMALVPPDVAEAIEFGDDHPDHPMSRGDLPSLDELWRIVAHYLQDRIDSRETLGTALGRLGGS